MIPQLFKTKLTAGVIAVTFCSAGVAAAATGGLPGPLQRGLDRAAQVVGHDVPPNHGSADTAGEMDGDDDTSTTSSGSTTSTTGATTSTEDSTTSTNGATTSATTSPSSDETTTVTTDDMDDDAEHDGDAKDTPIGPDATGPAKKGLCNAYMHSVARGHSQNADAVAFRNLTKAATDAGQTVEEFCGDDGMPVDTGTTTASSTPASSSSTPASDDDDDDDATSTSAKAHGKSDKAASNAKSGKPGKP